MEFYQPLDLPDLPTAYPGVPARAWLDSTGFVRRGPAGPVGSTNITATAHGFTVGLKNVPVEFSTGGWTLAHAETQPLIEGLLLVVSEVVDVNTLAVLDRPGLVRSDAHGLGVSGDVLWLNPDSAAPGIFTTVRPTPATDPGEYLIRFGMVIDGDHWWWQLPEWIEEIPSP